MYLLVIISLFFLSVSATLTNLDDILPTCKSKQGKYAVASKCWKEILGDINPFLKYVNSSIDPLKINTLNISRDDPGVGAFNVNYTNLEFTGLKNSVISVNEIDLDSLTFTFKWRIPHLHLDTAFDLDGDLFGFQFNNSSGDAEADYWNVAIDIVSTGHLKEDSSYISWEIDEADISYKTAKVGIKSGLEDQKTINAFNKTINEKIDLVYACYRSIIRNTIGSFVLSELNKLHQVRSSQDLYGIRLFGRVK